MAKFKTLELHLTQMTTLRLGPNSYSHDITLVDWDDGEKVHATMVLNHPITAVTPMRIRVVEEDIPEAPVP